MLSNQSHPLPPPSLLLSIFPSIRVFSNESALPIKWPRSFSFSISPCSEYSGLISFRIDWFDLFAVHGTLKSLLQHHSSKASILQYSTFFMVQLFHTYMTAGKSIALTIWTFVCKMMSLLFIVFFFQLIYFNWRMITLQYCDAFCHTSTLISHRYACGSSS